MIYEYPVTIKEHHLDTFGHVNNAKYLEIFEDARWELIRKNGYGLEEVHARKIGPVILAVNMQFKLEIRNRDEIIVTTECTSYKGKIGELKQVMKNAKGEDACIAIFTFGLFDLAARKLILPTPEWLKAIG